MAKLMVVSPGDKYGKLTIIREIGAKVLPSGIKPRAFLCVCDCGIEKEALLLHITRMRVGCRCSGPDYHGGSNTYLYDLWNKIRWRTSSKYHERQFYFDRGISVCEEWRKSFRVFREWCINNGYERHLQLDRMDNDLGYSPGNCRFVTAIINQNNKRNNRKVIYKGKEWCFALLCREMGLIHKSTTIAHRINRGWNVDGAFDTPIRKGNYRRKNNLNENQATENTETRRADLQKGQNS